MLNQRPKRHRYPTCLISHCVWMYHRFSLSYRDIEELMMARGVRVSYEGLRQWCLKFSRALIEGLRKKEPKRGDKWHLDEMAVRVNGKPYVLWRAVGSEGYELDIFLLKRRNKKSATRFLKRLLGTHPEPQVIVTDKLRSYCQPIKTLAPQAEHRRHKRLNNRAENSHQPIQRRKNHSSK